MAKQPEVRYINFYVSGNIAYQPEKSRKTGSRTQLPAMPREKKQLRTVDMGAVCCVVLAAVLLIALAVSAMQFIGAREDAAQMQRYVASLKQENETLTGIYTGSFDPEEVQKIAEGLGMIPAEQAKHITMQVELPVTVKEPTAWESFLRFLTGLFA